MVTSKARCTMGTLLEWAMLRRDNHHIPNFWRRVLLPVIEQYRKYDIHKFFRGDVAFANPVLMTLACSPKPDLCGMRVLTSFQPLG